MKHDHFVSCFCRFLSLLFLASAALSIASGPDEIAKMIDSVGEIHGGEAQKRVLEWQKVLRESAMLPEEDKLVRVNMFFNRIPPGEDIVSWGVKDYWATPLEFIIANKGDCEDYATAKYLSLLQIGVPEARLRITYVTAYLPDRHLLQSHMVLGYYPTPSAEPLILDNLVTAILPASKRPDLSPVLGFNSSGLWSAKLEKSGDSKRGGNLPGGWRAMQQRMNNEPVTLQ